MDLGADDYLTKPFTRAELLGAMASRLNKQEVVMKHYQTERDRAESLQKKVIELQQYVENQEEVLQQLQQELRNSVPKITMAIGFLKSMQSGARRDRCIEILQQSCQAEIALLNQPNLQRFLTPADLALLHQVNLISATSVSHT